jgi:hypothetical protein
MRLRVAPHPASSGSAGDRVSGCPSLAPFGASGGGSQVTPFSTSSVAPVDASPGSPRLQHLPALPAMDLRVASNLASFSTSGSGTWSFLRSSELPVAPADAFPGLPRFLHLPAVPATDLRVAPNLKSFDASGAGASGFPSASHFQLRLPVRLRVAPPLSPSGFALGLSPRVTPISLSLGAG